MSVSVVIPAHNAGTFIDESIKSVLEQDWPVDEIIVVNDGSTDRSYDKLANLAGNIRVVNQPNRGVSAARNRGCQLATSEYIAILDADDVWLPGKLRAQMAHLTSHPATDAVFCQGMYWRAGPGEETWPRPRYTPAADDAALDAKRLRYETFLYSIPVATSTMVVRKRVWQAMGGYDERMRYAEDQDFNLRLSQRYQVDLIKIVGMLYRQHSHNATARVQDRNYWADVITNAIRSLGLADASGKKADPGKIKRRLALVHFFHGYDHFWRGQLPIARREFYSAARLNPRLLKAIKYFLITAIPGLPLMIRRHQLTIREYLGRSSTAVQPRSNAFQEAYKDSAMFDPVP